MAVLRRKTLFKRFDGKFSVNFFNYLVNFTVLRTNCLVNFMVFPSENRNLRSEHLRGQVTPLERTFGGVSAPNKRSLALIP
jgi:hypothetical protein